MDPFSQMGLPRPTKPVDSPKIIWKVFFGAIVAFFLGFVVYSIVQAARGDGSMAVAALLVGAIVTVPWAIPIGQYLWKTRGQPSEEESDDVEEGDPESSDSSE